MKFFISYCENDGEGLKYAKQVKGICKNRNIETWIWSSDSSSAISLRSDIAENVMGCDAMLIIATSGTENSTAQKQEWSFADSFHKVSASLKIKGVPIPPELRCSKCPEFIDSDFEAVCNTVIDDIVAVLKSNMPTTVKDTGKTNQLFNIAKKLEEHQEKLNTDKIKGFHDNVWGGYLGSAKVRNVVNLAEASNEDKDKLRNIVLYSTIDLDKFNAKDYLWGPAFSQLGREIAAGEEKELIKSIQAEIKEIKDRCNEKNDELSIIQGEIERLNSTGHMPDVILAPPSMLKSFVHFFKEEKGKLDFPNELGSAATLEIKGLGVLRIYLLGKGILADNVIVFNRSSIVWKVLLNPDTGDALTMGIGRDIYPDKVKFIIGTTTRYAFKTKEGISMIPIER